MASGTKTRNLGRMSEIAQVAVKHGFGYFFSRNKLTDLLPGQEISPDGDASSERGRRLRETFDELGPTFVKFGQLLSTRPDVVPPDIVVELRKLQDDVSPFPFSQVEQVISEELGQPIERLFVGFVEQPIAAASIGQVHDAVLPNGRRVAVKVQRPTAPRQIEADLALLYQAAKIAKDRVRALDFIDAQSLVDEFARSLREELDYRQEARNASTFHRNFAGHPRVRIPRVYWSYTGARVLTLEFLDGTKIADLQPGELSDDERRRLAYAMAEAWMTMVFRHGIFHGDPHPANILMLGHPERIGLVDFGQAGRLTDDDMSKLTALFIDAAAENVEALPKRLADLGVRYDKTREAEFVGHLREFYARYYGVRLSEIDQIQVIREGFQLIYEMNLHLPSRYVLLDKAIATLGSVGAELYPDFNVFEVAKPYARELMVQRFSPGRLARDARNDVRDLVRVLRVAPQQLHDLLESLRNGQIEVRMARDELDTVLRNLDVAFNRLVIALVVAAGLIGSSFLAAAATGPGLQVLAGLGFALSFLLGVWLMWGVIRHGRL
ncbi:MAG: ABC1 kinase family protein [Gaiellaceae bacterium]